MLTKIRRKLNKKGFTLIELMIVIAIIGILAAIAIPQFASYRKKAYNSAALSDLKTAKTSLEAYYADTQEYP
jgi:type II secretion system protein G